MENEFALKNEFAMKNAFAVFFKDNAGDCFECEQLQFGFYIQPLIKKGKEFR